MSQIAARLVKPPSMPSGRPQVSRLCFVSKHDGRLSSWIVINQSYRLMKIISFRINSISVFLSAKTGVISIPQHHPNMKAWYQNRVVPDDQTITCCVENNTIISSQLPLCSRIHDSRVDLKQRQAKICLCFPNTQEEERNSLSCIIKNHLKKNSCIVEDLVWYVDK